MDQIKIGKFIADERKRKGYTQKKLSEKLEISDKTISKWERGNGFPEVSLLLDNLEVYPEAESLESFVLAQFKEGKMNW